VIAGTYEGPGGDPLVGQTLDGRFKLKNLLGLGGMGRVYQAEQISVGRPVALKVLRTRFARDPQRLKRFTREARATCRLKHPNTIRIFDFGMTADEFPYIVSEHLDGHPLDDVIWNDAPMGAVRCVEIVDQVLRSLGEAHEAGIVHRDMKPSNVFICEVYGETDFVKVMDFGIAKLNDTFRLTRTGAVIGTPAYMSPEQACGEELDGRSDLYSVGVMMYEMLTGALPFTANSAVLMQMAHVEAKVPPLMAGGTPVPAPLADAVLWCLSKEPHNRPQSAAALRERLHTAVAQLGMAPPPRWEAKTMALPTLKPADLATIAVAPAEPTEEVGAPPRQSRGWMWIAAAVVALAAAVALLLTRS